MNGQAFNYLASAIVGIALGAATINANNGQDHDPAIVCSGPGCGEQTIELACDRPGCGNDQTVQLACTSGSGCGNDQTIELACDRPSCSDGQTAPKNV